MRRFSSTNRQRALVLRTLACLKAQAWLIGGERGPQKEVIQFRQFHQHRTIKHQRGGITDTDGTPDGYPTRIERVREWGSTNNDSRDTLREGRYTHTHGQHKNKNNTNNQNNKHTNNYNDDGNSVKYSNNQTNTNKSHTFISTHISSHRRPRHGNLYQQHEERGPENGDTWGRGGRFQKGHIATGIGQSTQYHNNSGDGNARQLERGRSGGKEGVTIRDGDIVVNSSHSHSHSGNMNNGSCRRTQGEDRASSSSHTMGQEGTSAITSISSSEEASTVARADGGLDREGRVRLTLCTRGADTGKRDGLGTRDTHARADYADTHKGLPPSPPLRVARTTLASLSDGLWHRLSTSSHTIGKGRRAVKALGRSQSDLGAVRGMVDSLLEGYGLNNTAISGGGDGSVGVEGADDRKGCGRAVFFGDSVPRRCSSTSTMKEKEESLAHMISVLVSAWSDEMGLPSTKSGHSTSIGVSSGHHNNKYHNSGYREKGKGLRTTTSTLFDVVRMMRCLVSILTVSNDAIRGPIDRWSPRQVEGAAACFAATSIILLRYHSHLNHHDHHHNNDDNIRHLDAPSPSDGCASSSSTPFVRGGPLCSTILGMRTLHQRLLGDSVAAAAPPWHHGGEGSGEVHVATVAAAKSDEGRRAVGGGEPWHFLEAANETAAADPRRALCEEYLVQPWFVSLVARSSLASRSSRSSLANSSERGQTAIFVNTHSDDLLWRMSDRAEELLLSAINHAHGHDFGDDEEKEKEAVYSSTPHHTPRTSSTLRSGQRGHSSNKGRLSYFYPYANIAQLVLGILAVEWEQRLLLQYVSLRCAFVSIPSSVLYSPRNEDQPGDAPSTGHNNPSTPNPAVKAPMHRLPPHLKPEHALIIGDAPAQIGIKALEALLHIAVGGHNNFINSTNASPPPANQLFIEQITQTLAVAFHVALEVFETAAKAPVSEVSFGGCDYQGDSPQRSNDVGRDMTRATRKGFRPPRHNNSKYDKICDEAFSSLERLHTMIREWGAAAYAPAGLSGSKRGTAVGTLADQRDTAVGYGSPSVFRRGRTSERGGHALSTVSQPPVAAGCGTRWVGDKDFVQRLFTFPEKSLRRLPFTVVLSSSAGHHHVTKTTERNGDTYEEESPSNETNTRSNSVFILAPTAFRFERIEEGLFCLVLPLVEICSNILLTVPFPLPFNASSALTNSDASTQGSKLPSQSCGAFAPYFPRCPYGHTMEGWIMLICNIVAHYCVFPCPRGVLAVLEWLIRLCEHVDAAKSNNDIALLPSLGKDEGTRRPAVDGGKGQDHRHHMPLRTLFGCLTHDPAMSPKEGEGFGRGESRVRAAEEERPIDLTRVARAVLLASSSAGAEWDASMPCASSGNSDDGSENGHMPLSNPSGKPPGATKGGSGGSGLSVIRGLGLEGAAADGDRWSFNRQHFTRPSLYTCPTLLGGDTLSALYKHAHACDIARSSDTLYCAAHNEEEKRSLKNSCDLEVDSECMICEEENDRTDAELLVSAQNSLGKRKGPQHGGSFLARDYSLVRANEVNGRGERPYNYLRCIAYLPQPCLTLALYLARAATDGFVVKQHDCGEGAGDSVVPLSVGGGVHHHKGDDDAAAVKVGVGVDVSTVLFCLKEALSIVDGVGMSSPLASAELPAGLLESVLSIRHDGLGSSTASADMNQHNKSPISEANHPDAKSTTSVSPPPPLAAHNRLVGQFDSYDAFGLAMSLIRLNEVYEHGRLNKWMLCNDSSRPLADLWQGMNNKRGVSNDRNKNDEVGSRRAFERREREQTLLSSSFQSNASRSTASLASPPLPWSRAGEVAAVRMAHHSLFALLMPFINHSEISHNSSSSRIVKESADAERLTEAGHMHLHTHVSSPFLWRITMEGLVKSYRSWGPAVLLPPPPLPSPKAAFAASGNAKEAERIRARGDGIIDDDTVVEVQSVGGAPHIVVPSAANEEPHGHTNARRKSVKMASTNLGKSASTVGTLMRFILVITRRMHTVLAPNREPTHGGTSRAGRRAMEAPEGYVCALLQFEKLCRDIANGRTHSKHKTSSRASPIHGSTPYYDDTAGVGPDCSIEIDLVEKEILSAYGRLVLEKRMGIGAICGAGTGQEPIGRDTSASIETLAGSCVPHPPPMPMEMVPSHTKYDVLNTFRAACGQLSPEAIANTTNRLSFSVAEAAAIPFEGGAFEEDEHTGEDTSCWCGGQHQQREDEVWRADRPSEYNTFAQMYTEVCSNRLGW